MVKATTANTRWIKYVGSVTGGETQAVIGQRAGVSAATISRWSVAAPRPENVAAFARAYERPVLEAFVAAGFLTQEEAGERPFAKADLSSFSNEELLQEIGSRLDQQDAYELAAYVEDPAIGPEDLPNET